MSKKLIGKRVRLHIGNKPPEDDDPDTIIGEDTTVHVTPDELHKYDKIVGEEVTLMIGDINEPIQKIIQTIDNSDEPQKDEIIKLCREIITEENKKTKSEKIQSLISISSGIISIATFVTDLKAKVGL